jgi:dihydrofolate reductase
LPAAAESHELAGDPGPQARGAWLPGAAKVRRFKATAEHDITVNGPELAAHAVRAGLVDEFQMIVFPVIVGGGRRFFPEGVRLNLELVEDRRFGNGVVALRYAARD